MKPSKTLSFVTAVRKRHVVEISLGIAVVLVLPPLLTLTASLTNPLFFVLGFGGLIGQLTGAPLQTDIGWEVAASAALLEPGVSAYAPLPQLGPLIGMETVEGSSHTHPPPSLALWLPLAVIPYTGWIGSWVLGMIVCLAWSFRIMSVPASFAYFLALGVALTRVGQVSITTTYPVLALAIAVAWRWRSGTWLPGVSLALIAASRGFGGLLLLYPLLRRQWRLVVVAMVVGIGLTIISVMLEPNVISGFLTQGRAAIEYNLTRPMTTPMAILDFLGLPSLLVGVLAIAVVLLSLLRGNSLFWALNWLSFVVMPIGWAHASVMLLPLAVVIWRAGRVGQILILGAGVSLTAFTLGVVVIWPLGLLATGLGLIFCHIPDSHDPLLKSRMWTRVRQLVQPHAPGKRALARLWKRTGIVGQYQ